MGAAVLLTGTLIAADLKDDVKNAAKKLGDAGGYAWKATVESAGGGGGGGGRGAPGPTEGKVAKEGIVCLKMTRGETTTEAFVKGEKGAIKGQEGWQSLAELTQGDSGGGGRGRGGFMARRLQNYKAPAAEAAEMADKVKELKKEGDAICGEFTEDGAKSYLTMGGRGGGANPPAVEGAKGTVKFWIKNGVLAKYEYNVKGKMTFNNNEREIDRTTTVEIKDVGATKVEVPEDAKKKLL
jgi:hypothetical protein